MQAAGQFVKLVRQKLDGGGKAVRAQRAAPQPRPRMEGPKRRSTRLEGRPAPVYNERALEALDGKAKSGRLPRSFGTAGLAVGPYESSSDMLDNCWTTAEASTEEIYTEEHVKALGNYKEPWYMTPSVLRRLISRVPCDGKSDSNGISVAGNCSRAAMMSLGRAYMTKPMARRATSAAKRRWAPTPPAPIATAYGSVNVLLSFHLEVAMHIY